MTDYAALVARLRAHISKAGHDAEQCANDGLDLAGDAADAIEQLTRTVAEQERTIARQHELLFAFHAATDPEKHAEICESIGEESDWCDAKFVALRAQLTAETARADELKRLLNASLALQAESEEEATAATACLRTVEAETWNGTIVGADVRTKTVTVRLKEKPHDLQIGADARLTYAEPIPYEEMQRRATAAREGT